MRVKRRGPGRDTSRDTCPERAIPSARPPGFARSAGSRDNATMEEPEATPPPSGEPRPLVLVAEDDADIRQLLVVHVRREGCEAVEVADGQAALDAVRERTPDL